MQATKTQRRIAGSIQQREHIKSCFRVILKFAQKHIQDQGGGCNLPGYGAVYRMNDKRDVIAGLLPPKTPLLGVFRTISSEDLKPIVKKISKTYGYARYGMENNPKPLVTFLQMLQDAHDFSFDEYYDVSGDRMEHFQKMCKEIEHHIEEL